MLLNGPLELAIPYLLARTGSDRSMSWLLGAMNAGSLIAGKSRIGGTLAGAMTVSGRFNARRGAEAELRCEN